MRVLGRGSFEIPIEAEGVKPEGGTETGEAPGGEKKIMKYEFFAINALTIDQPQEGVELADL